MPAEASGNESNPPEPREEDQRMVAGSILRSVWTLTILLVVWGMWIMMLNDDEIQLHVLNFTVKLLQTVARVIGAWAIVVEDHYNDVVNSLH